jgi:ABC-type transport system substrate-binding protein
MVLGVVGSPATLDPYSRLASPLTYELAVPVYPSLFRFAPNGVPHPYLARRLETISGGVRVTLRPAQWSDGSPVSATDVVRTWRRARHPSGLSAVTSARVVSPRVVVLRGKVAQWKQTLATLSYVLPGGRPKRLSAGPFRVQSYQPGLRIAFVRNSRWWARAALQHLNVEFVQSLQVLLLLLGRGTIDAAAPPSSVNLDDRLHALGVHHSDALGWESVQLRFRGTALDQVQRRTITAAVDRAMLTTGFVRSEGRSSTSLHPQPGAGGAGGPWAHHFPNGPRIDRSITLSVPSGDELLELTQRVLQSELSRAASDVELVGIDPQTFYGPWRQHDPTDVALLRVPGAPGLGGGTGAYDNLTAVPLFQTETVLAWRDGVEGLRADPTFDGPLWNAETWTVRAP